MKNTVTIHLTHENAEETRRWLDDVAAAAPAPVSLVVAPEVFEALSRAAVVVGSPPPFAGMPMKVNGCLPIGDAWAVYRDGSMVNLRTGATAATLPSHEFHALERFVKAGGEL